MIPKREELARELETIASEQQDASYKRELEGVIQQVRSDSMEDAPIVGVLRRLRLGFFANKLDSGLYERNFENYKSWLESNDTTKVQQTAQEDQPEA